MLKFIQHYFIAFLVLGCVGLYSLKSDRYFGWSDFNSKDGEAVLSDGAGYYAYLPQWFIFKTKHFEFIDSIKTSYPKSRFTDGIGPNKHYKFNTNKYYIGTALCIAPFFLIAHSYSYITDLVLDGYNWPYMMAVNGAALFYFGLGLFYLLKIFKLLKIKKIVQVVLITALILSTNLSYYTTILPSCSHIYSFGVNTVILYFLLKIYSSSTVNWLNLCIVSFLIGFSFIIRPTNVLIVLSLPFLGYISSEINQFEWRKFIPSIKTGCVVFTLFLIPIVVQLIQNYYQYNSWVLNSYSEEGFTNWDNPKWVEVLFSSDKGFFIYAPFFIVLLICNFNWMIKKEFKTFFFFMVFFIPLLYITSAWWCWWYGGGLGMRPFIDFYAVLILPIALFINGLHRIKLGLISLYLCVCVFVYFVFELQLRRNILHYNRMTYAQFFSVWMKTAPRYEWILHYKFDKIPNEYSKFKVLKGNRGNNQMFQTISWKNENSSDSQELAIQWKGKLKLTDNYHRPFIQTAFFKNGSCFKTINTPVHVLFEDLNTWNEIKIEQLSGLKMNQIDEVQITPKSDESFTKCQSQEVIFLRK